MKTVLVTGSAGFIGFHLVKALLRLGYKVIGIDSLNDYYDTQLKKARLYDLDLFVKDIKTGDRYSFIHLDLANRESVEKLFRDYFFDAVVHLAAQAGVRYSIDNPHAYIDANIQGFLNVLEGCRRSKVGHFLYASSSSVYGNSTKQPFSEKDCANNPISLYAATKKSNELMAHTYSHLFNIPTTGLRFFTVYGPWGRPDMAYFKFTKAIFNNQPIDVYNCGELMRDFTYIDDIIDGVIRVVGKGFVNSLENSNISGAIDSTALYQIYNIGSGNPISLKRFIEAIEIACDKQAVKNILPMQPGDVAITYADISKLKADTGFSPNTTIEFGVSKFVEWYRKYNNQ